MTLANYINDLLYRYDCVIVPNFGGFVTNKIGAKVNDETQKFYPPKKQITFNTYLQHNDGLLANYVASNEKISFEEALQKIADTVADWKILLEEGKVLIAEVGTLALNSNKQISFEPNPNSNFLTESFGLAEVASPEVTREIETPVIELPKEELVANEDKTTVIPLIAKRAAAAVIVLGLGYGGLNMYNKNEQNKAFASQKEALDKKIQSATFIIDNPLPTIDLNVTKEASERFHIIAGAFLSENNAQNKVDSLTDAGFKAKTIGKNAAGLTQVTYGSYTTQEEAREALLNIQQNISEDAWLLVKELP